jgi:hypothetical protein
MDDAVWDVIRRGGFAKNRERLIEGAVSQRLLESVLVEAREHNLLSEEHFTVDGTLIQAGVPTAENRNGLVVAAEATLAATAAEREAALRMLDQTVAPKDKRIPEQKITLGADTQYQDEKFVQDLRDREVAPHISEYTQGGSNMGKNSLTDEERQDARRAISQRKRKLIERVSGWSKLDRPLRQAKLRGLDRVDWLYRLTIVAHNLVRMRRLIPNEALAC